MRTPKFVYVFFVLAFIVSCSSGNNNFNETPAFAEKELSQLTEAETKVLFRMREPDNRVSIDEVMKLTDGIIAFLDEGNALKSGPNRRVNSISALVSENNPVALKSSEYNDIEFPDTLAYILNFNDSLGFVIISADIRIDEPILAFVDGGSLIDSTDNPGIAIFLELLEDYSFNSIAESERQKDSLLSGIYAKLGEEINTKAFFNFTYLREISRKTIGKVGPFMPVEWGQGSPYNDNVGGKCGANGTSKYPAGCVATAIAQIMAHWKYPSSINNYSFNWTDMNKYTSRASYYTGVGSERITTAPSNVKTQMANLFQQIGSGVKMNYNCNGSGANNANTMDFFKNRGFKVDGLKGYDLGRTITALDKKQPLYAMGCSKETKNVTKFLGITISTSYSYSGCHAWVIDGYLKQEITYNLIEEDITTGRVISQRVVYGNSSYMHNNWGWNGSGNGFFASEVFNTNLSPISSNTKSGEPYNYQYKIEMTPIYR